jgi:hypothetical protein
LASVGPKIASDMSSLVALGVGGCGLVTMIRWKMAATLWLVGWRWGGLKFLSGQKLGQMLGGSFRTLTGFRGVLWAPSVPVWYPRTYHIWPKKEPPVGVVNPLAVKFFKSILQREFLYVSKNSSRLALQGNTRKSIVWQINQCGSSRYMIMPECWKFTLLERLCWCVVWTFKWCW